MEYAVRLYGKVFALRFDLRVPLEYNYDDTNLVTRFISSLKAQLNAHHQRKQRQSDSTEPWNEAGGAVPFCQMRAASGLDAGAAADPYSSSRS